MKVLILNWRDPKHPLAGGAEYVLYKYARYWMKRGIDVTWFASSFRNGKYSEEIDGIKIIRKGSHYTVFLWFAFHYLMKGFRSYDVFIDCFHFVPFFTPLYVKNKKIVALIHEVAGNVWFANLPLVFAYIGYRLEPYFLQIYKKNQFITVSKSTEKDLIAYKVPKKNITVIPNGFDIPKLRKKIVKDKTPTLLYIGKIAKDKGIEDALLAVELLMRDIKDIRLYIAGKSENKKYTRHIKDLIKQFKVQKNCTFLGFVDDAEKTELMRKSWILVHPSSREGWGLNVIEANSLGTPAVGYDVPGLKDSIIHNKTGLLVQSDAISLADGIEELINDRKRYSKMSAEAIKWSKNFDFEKSGKISYDFLINLK